MDPDLKKSLIKELQIIDDALCDLHDYFRVNSNYMSKESYECQFETLINRKDDIAATLGTDMQLKSGHPYR